MKNIVFYILLTLIPCASYASISHEAKVALRLHDYKKAVKSLKKQATKNNADAQYHLALLYKTGKGTNKNNKKALYWFRKSAKNGNVRAQYNCGIMYEKGYGTKPSKRKASYWYKKAAKKGHKKSKQRLVSLSNKVPKTSNIFNAIQNNNITFTKSFAKKCPNISSAGGENPLVYAINQDKEKQAKILLRCKNYLYTKNDATDTALVTAIKKKQHNIVKLISTRYKKHTNRSNKAGITPLMEAVIVNDITSAKHLISGGAKINARDNKGNTAYKLATIRQHKNMQNLLATHGAKGSKRSSLNVPSRSHNKGQWPLLVKAAWKGDEKMALALLKKYKQPDVTDPNGNTALTRASERGYRNIVSLLISYSANTGKPNKKGVTPLIAAARNGHTETCKLLLASKVNINHKDKKGMTAALHAAYTGKVKTLELLSKNKADFSVKDNKKRNLFEVAKAGRHESVISYLIIKNKIRLNNKALSSQLLYSSNSGLYKLTKILIKKGAKINVTEKNGDTPLMLAAHRGNGKIVKLLLKNQADIDKKNRHGNTALMIASKSGKKNIVAQLLKAKANIAIRNKDRKTAIDLAKSSGHNNIVKLIKTNDKNNSIFGIF